MGLENLDIFKTSMPSSRPADFYLVCLDGSVFIDFNLNEKGCLYLKRISFDEYGCCEVRGDVISLNRKDSQFFIDNYDREMIDKKRFSKIVRSTIRLNADLIWKEALYRYGLLEE